MKIRVNIKKLTLFILLAGVFYGGHPLFSAQPPTPEEIAESVAKQLYFKMSFREMDPPIDFKMLSNRMAKIKDLLDNKKADPNMPFLLEFFDDESIYTPFMHLFDITLNDIKTYSDSDMESKAKLDDDIALFKLLTRRAPIKSQSNPRIDILTKAQKIKKAIETNPNAIETDTYNYGLAVPINPSQRTAILQFIEAIEKNSEEYRKKRKEGIHEYLKSPASEEKGKEKNIPYLAQPIREKILNIEEALE